MSVLIIGGMGFIGSKVTKSIVYLGNTRLRKDTRFNFGYSIPDGLREHVATQPTLNAEEVR